MEFTETFEGKIATLEKALNTFETLLYRDLSGLDEVLLDGIENGCIQKFEYSIELTWKLAKFFLENHALMISPSPKEAIKNLLLSGTINEEVYEHLFNALLDRNKLSHIYKEDYFHQIFAKLPIHLDTMKKTLNAIKASTI